MVNLSVAARETNRHAEEQNDTCSEVPGTSKELKGKNLPFIFDP